MLFADNGTYKDDFLHHEVMWTVIHLTYGELVALLGGTATALLCKDRKSSAIRLSPALHLSFHKHKKQPPVRVAVFCLAYVLYQNA